MEQNNNRPNTQPVEGPDSDPKKAKPTNPPAEKPNPVTDPQESMKGPVSSFMQGIKERAEKNDDKEKEAHEYKEKHSGGDFINK